MTGLTFDIIGRRIEGIARGAWPGRSVERVTSQRGGPPLRGARSPDDAGVLAQYGGETAPAQRGAADGCAAGDFGLRQPHGPAPLDEFTGQANAQRGHGRIVPASEFVG